MPSVIQRSFAAGEISPALAARSDQAKYQTGLRACRNFIVRRSGGIDNRPGLRYLGAVKDADQPARLLPFVFNADQTYLLEFGELVLRIWRNDALLTSGASVYEVVSPYAAADVGDLKYAQSGDVVTITHRDYPPYDLSRTGHTSWTLAARTVGPTTAAPVGLAVSTPGAGSTTYTYVVTAIDATTSEESLACAPVSVTSALDAPTDVAPISLAWTTSSASEWRVYKSRNGVFGFVGVTPTATFQDGGITADVTDTPPIARDPFASTGNYPGVVGYYQQRILFGNTINHPERLEGSRPGSFRNFTRSSPIQDDDSLSFTLVGARVNAIEHVLDLGSLVVLTGGAEWEIMGNGDGVITPQQPNARPRSHNGSSAVSPVIVNDSAVFLQARRGILRDLRYDNNAGGYTGRDLSVFAEHLFEGHDIVRLAYAQIPNSVIWAVRDDGVMLGLTYLREHEIWGWHRHDTDGLIEDVCVLPVGREDVTYVVVKRTIGGLEKRYVERLESRYIEDVAADAFFVDCGLTYDGRNTGSETMTLSGGTTWGYGETWTLTRSAGGFSAGEVGNQIVLTVGDDQLRLLITAYTSGTVVSVRGNRDAAAAFRSVAITDWARAVETFTGLGHLEGKAVVALSEGNVVRGLTVTGGEVELPEPGYLVHVGLPYDCDAETLDVDDPQGSTLRDKRKRVSSVGLMLDKSRGGSVGKDEDNLVEIKQREDEFYDDPVALQTGMLYTVPSAQWGDAGRVFIRQSDPLPFTLLAAVPDFEIGGRS